MCHTLSAELFGVGHARFQANFPFAKSQQMQNRLFRTPPRQFETLCEVSMEKILHIVLKADNLAHLYKILSDYHVNVHNCVPWTDEALCKIWCKLANSNLVAV